jgi:hypothetical protein
VAFIVVVALVAYGRQLSFELTDVDVLPQILTGRFESLEDLTTILTEPFLQGRMPNATYWRPFTSFTYGLDALVWGLDPFGYQLTDLVLHVTTAVVLYLFVALLWRRLGRSGAEPVALASSLIFVLHPVQVEDVPAVARRADLLVGLFLILTLWFLLKAIHRNHGPGWAASMAAVLGMASKESGFSIPIVGSLFLICFLPGEPGREWKRWLRWTVPLIGCGTLMFLFREAVLGGGTLTFLFREAVLGGGDPAHPLWWLVPAAAWLHISDVLLAGVPGIPALARPWWWGERMALSLVLALALAATIVVLALCVRAAVRKVGGLSWRSTAIRLSTFLFGAIAVLYLVHFQTFYVARYLYSTMLFVAVLVAWGGERAVRACVRPASPRGRTLRVALLMGFALLISSWLLASPIVQDGPIEQWHTSGAISRRVLGEVEAHAAQLDTGTRLYLVNFPYILEGPRIPLAVMLLDHSVQAWLDLRLPEKKFDVVGVSFVSFEPPVDRILFSAEMEPGRRLKIRVSGKITATVFPWANDLHPAGTLFEFEGPTRKTGRLDIRMLDDTPEAVFLVWNLHDVELHRGWNWKVVGGASAVARRGSGGTELTAIQ